jgi:hypothetical protein
MNPSARFTSDRERRLWFWTGAALVAIYSTLGPARTLADALRQRNLLGISFVVLVGVLVSAFAVRWIRRRPGWGEVGAAIGVALAYWGAFLRIESPEERTHLIEYGIVAALIHQALLERAKNGRPVPAPAVLTVVVTALLGVLDETIQAMLPSRVFDVRDIGFNALAGFMIIAARLALAPQRGPGWRIWFLWLIASAWGWGVGMYTPYGTPGGIETLQSAPPVVLAGFLGVATGAILVAVLHWLILRRHVTGATRWLLTPLGATAVVGAVVFGLGAIDADVGWVVGTGSYGLAAGLLQWPVLRRQIPQAGWWVFASTAGWIAGVPYGEYVGWNGLGAVYGIATGTALVLLLRRSQSVPTAAV